MIDAPPDPDTIPPDPLDVTRPDDADACSPCDGTGAVLVWHEGVQMDEMCPRCDGIGVASW